MNRLFGVVALVLSTTALAQSLPAFEQVDGDRDGLISRDEARAIEGLDFDAADTNQDTYLDREEYAAIS